MKSDLFLIDTSVYTNILGISGFDQDKTKVQQDFKEYIEADAEFLLPISTIWETGNHIAHVSGGEKRKNLAEIFKNDVINALKGETPYTPTHFPETTELINWLEKFPLSAQKSKSENKEKKEGMSWGDHSIIQEWTALHEKYKKERHVTIWSLDADLKGYSV